LVQLFSKVVIVFGTAFFKSGDCFWYSFFQKWRLFLVQLWKKAVNVFGTAFFKSCKNEI
jgi:hypothetical protein